MMKPILYTVLSLGLLSTAVSCTKSTDSTCTEVSVTIPARDSVALANYIADNNIAATYDSRGFYYVMSNSGGETKPSQCATVRIDYTGKLSNGTTFDSNTNTSFSLESLIAGWRMGVPLIGEGGEITLYLPAALGYGDNDNGSIPGGSITIFKIKLHSVTVE